MKRKVKTLFFSLLGIAGFGTFACNTIVSSKQNSDNFLSTHKTNVIDSNENSLEEKNDSLIEQGFSSENLNTQSKTQEYKTRYMNSPQAKDAFATGEIVINDDNSMTLSGTLDLGTYVHQGPRDLVIFTLKDNSNNRSIVAFDTVTCQEVWTLTGLKTVGQVIVKNTGSKSLCYVLCQDQKDFNDNTMTLKILNAETGDSISSHLFTNPTTFNNHSRVFNVQYYGITQYKENNDVIVSPRGLMTNSERFASTTKLVIDSNGNITSTSAYSLVDNDTTQSRVLATDAFTIGSDDFFIQWWTDDSNILKLKIFKNKATSTELQWDTNTPINGYDFGSDAHSDYKIKYFYEQGVSSTQANGMKLFYLFPGKKPKLAIFDINNSNTAQPIQFKKMVDFIEIKPINISQVNVIGEYAYAICTSGQLTGLVSDLTNTVVKMKLTEPTFETNGIIASGTNVDKFSHYKFPDTNFIPFSEKWASVGASSNGNIALIQGNKLWLINPQGNNGKGSWAWNTTWIDSNTSLLVNLTNAANLYAVEHRENTSFQPLVSPEIVRTKILKQTRTDTEYWFTNFNNDDTLVYEGKVQCNISARKIYDNGILKDVHQFPEKLTFTGFHQYETTAIKEMNVAGTSWANAYPSDISDQEILKQIRNNTTTIFTDLPLGFRQDHIDFVLATKNNLAGEIEATISLSSYINSSHQLVNEKIEKTIILKGFKDAHQTKFIGKEMSINDFTTGNFAALAKKKEKDINVSEISSLIFDNREMFFKNLPFIDNANMFVTILNTSIGKGVIEIEIKVNKIYNSQGIQEVLKDPNTYVGGKVVITGFQKTKTALIRESYDFNSIWPTTTKPLLDDDLVDENFFKSAMVSKQNEMFVDLKRTINISDITFTNYPNPMSLLNVVNGSITLEFILSADACTHRNEMTITFTGFKRITTRLSNPSGIFGYGIPNKPSSQANIEDLKSIVKTNMVRIFENLPKEYSFDANVVVSGFDNSIPGQVSGDLLVKNVYTDSTTINTRITITGFRTQGITTELKDKAHLSYTLGGINGILASEISLSESNENAVKISFLPWFKSNLKNLNEVPIDSLNTSDIRLEIIPDSADNTIGLVRTKVHLINNKAWINGIPTPDFTFDDAIFELSGFKIQRSTEQVRDSMEAGPYSSQNSNKFTTSQAKRLIENNVDNIFDRTLPNDAIITIRNVTPNIAGASAQVEFVPSKVFNELGIKVDNTSLFTIRVDGFSTNFTGIINERITLTDVTSMYSTDTRINAEWVKSKLEPTMFKHLPPEPWVFKDNISVSNVRNNWNDSSVPFGTIKFDVTITDALTSTGTGIETIVIRNVEFTGFTTYGSTTICSETEVTGNNLGNVLASDVSISLINHSDKLVKAIIDSHNVKPVFTNLIPDVTLNANHIRINSVSNPDNYAGSLSVKGTLSSDIAWFNGVKKALDFELLMKGFSKSQPTKWMPDIIYAKEESISSIFVKEWSNPMAKQYVIDHSEKFFANVPTNFEPQRDIDVQIKQIENSAGIAYINVKLEQHNDISGNPSRDEFSHTFTIKGFMKPDNAPTSLKVHDLRNFAFRGYIDNEGHQGFWINKSPWIADIMANVQEYKDSLLEWLTIQDNAKMIFDHYSINGRVTTVKDVEIIYSSQNFNSIEVVIYLNNVSIGNDQYQNNKSFTLKLSNAKATRDIDVSSTLPGDAMDSLVLQFGNDEHIFKYELAKLFYDSLCEQVHGNNGINFPNVVIAEFPIDKNGRDEMILRIMNIIKINGSTSGKAPVKTASIESESLKQIFKNVNIGKLNLSITPPQVFTSHNSWISIVFLGGVAFAVFLLIFIAIIYFKKIRKIHEKHISKY